MGILDSVIGGLLGGNAQASPLQAILGQILGGGGGAQPGLGGLLQRFQQAGYGDHANSWVQNGPNQSIDPGALSHVFGHEQVNQWSQQSGIPSGDLLSQLSNLIPHAVDRMTPNGQVPNAEGGSPFDEGGVELR